MKKISGVVAILFVMLMVYCDRIFDSRETVVQLDVQHGTSFGECLGYCKKELIIKNSTAMYITSSWHPDQYPEKREIITLTQEQALRIRSQIRWTQFKSLPDRIGCPDCADGGAEWIEIQRQGTSKRVTFEFGSTPPGQAGLLELLRSMHKGLEF